MGKAQALQGLQDGEVQKDQQLIKKGKTFTRPLGDMTPKFQAPPWYFHPQRWEAMTGAPLDMDPMRAKLKEVDPRLDISWHPVRKKFQVWIRKPEIQFFACPGWKRIAMLGAIDDRLMWAVRSWQESHDEVFSGQATLDEAYGRVQGAIKRDQRALDAAAEDEAEQHGRECHQWGLGKVGYGEKSAEA